MRPLDLVTPRRRFFACSGALVALSLVLLAIPPTLRPGIEFTSGATTLLRFEGPVGQAGLRAAYAGLGHAEARIQSTGPNEFLIRTRELETPDTALIEVAPDAPDAPPDPVTLRLGAAGAAGDVALRVFHSGAACAFGPAIDGASFPAGTEAAVVEEVRACEPPADDGEGEDDSGGGDGGEGAGGDGGEGEDGDGGEGGDGASGEDGGADGDGGEGEDGDGDLLAYRVQVTDADGEAVTGFVDPADTHDVRLPGEAVETAPADLGERGVIEAELERRFGPFEVLEFASVSAVVSKRAVRNAAVAVVIASVFIMGYIVFAFSGMPHPLRYAVAAIVALLHDVIIVLGAFSLFGKLFGIEINLMFVTGLLTIIGFSVHDTIVIFDRVRENVRLAPNAPLGENVNAALVQTLGRSLNTSITLLFTILALLWLGGPTIGSFLLVLLVGVVAGAYSSVAIAAQVLVSWDEGDASRLLGRFRRRVPSEEPAGG